MHIHLQIPDSRFLSGGIYLEFLEEIQFFLENVGEQIWDRFVMD